LCGSTLETFPSSETRNSRRQAFFLLKEELERRGVGMVSWASSAKGPRPAAPWSLEDWPVGTVAVVGRGRTTLAAKALALATAKERPVAWIDVQGTFYPAGACRLGVRLERLLWIRPKDLADGLKSAHITLSGGALALIVLDLPGTLPVDRRVFSSLPRLSREARHTRGRLLVLTPAVLPKVTYTVTLFRTARGLVARWRRGAMGGDCAL
jgi:hypothetical protein